MKLEGRDRKTVFVGAIAAICIVVAAYVIIPVSRTWSDNQGRLASMQDQIATLKDRAESQESLAIRRNALVARLGALFGVAEVSVGPDSAGEAPPGPQSEEPEQSSTQAPAAEGQPAPAKDAKLEDNCSLAGYVEQTAQKAGIKIKRITPRRTSGGKGPGSGKHFQPVTLQVKVEASAPSFINMLAVLEGGEYLVRIDSIQIRRDIKKGDKIDATFEVVGYEATGRAL